MHTPPHTPRAWLRTLLGPGLLVAATGVGASDWVTSTVNGGRFGYTLLWVVLVGALLKAVLNEGIARWQLVTGHSIITGWRLHLPHWFRWVFLVYLLLWAALLGGSLAGACGMAAQSMLPLPLAPQHAVAVWGTLHLALGLWLTLTAHYERFERIMTGIVLLMFCTTVGATALLVHDWSAIAVYLIPQRPAPEQARAILSSIGGIGGSVSMLAYGYWLHDAHRRGAQWLFATRVDIALSYGLTALFNLCAMVIGAIALFPATNAAQHIALVHNVVTHLHQSVGAVGAWLFLIGFWGAVVGSLLGCLHGIPYLAADLMRPSARHEPASAAEHAALRHSPWYRRLLVILVIPPCLQLWLMTPVSMVMLFTLLASIFTPLLAASLLVLNNHPRWLGRHRNRWFSNIILSVALALFAYLLGTEIWNLR